jgi:phosphatidylglycerophosphate synthase
MQGMETCCQTRGKRFFPNPFSAEALRVRLARWSFIHATLILFATTISWTAESLQVLVFFGGVSFLLLIFLARSNWTEGDVFGPANMVTALRLAGVLALPLFFSSIDLTFVTVLGLILLAADGVDGWLARRCNQASEFGEYFDKETDAFFLLVLCTLAVLNQRLGIWILIAGLLRYVFVVVNHFFRANKLKEQKTARARIIYGLTMVALLVSFLPYPAFYKPLAMITTTGLVLSFMLDFYLVFSKD